MITIKINNLEFLVKSNLSVLEACKFLGYTIPRFCYHENLSISGNCRMCLVEIEGSEKPVASCVTDVEDGMSIWLNTAFVKKARENLLEILLINHPLDCPICDQAGECDLQDQAKNFGNDYSRLFQSKTTVEDKNCGPLIKTIMTRCIHCTRCVRFGDEIAGLGFLGTLNRGSSTEIGSYLSKMFESEISGNVIDLCPVGALTSKPYAFKARPWELRLTESIDLTDGVGSNTYINYKEVEILRITPKNNMFINENFISDKARFSFDSFKKNRISSLIERCGSSFNSLNWSSFLNKLVINKTTLIVNEKLGFFALQNVINLSYALGSVFKLVGDVSGKRENSYNQNYYDFITSIEEERVACYVFSSNIRIEACILNLRLRLKKQKNLFTINSFGPFFSNDVITKFIYLDLSSILNILEGKVKNHSNNICTEKSPLFIIGKSLNKRISNNLKIADLLRSFFINSKVINICNNSNSEGVNFFDIKNINTKAFYSTKSIISVKSEDTTFSRRIADKYKDFFLLWLNTHGSGLALKSNFILPIRSEFEEEEIYLNLERRPQKTSKIFNGLAESRSISSALSAIFNTKLTSTFLNKHTEYVVEMSNNINIFEINKKQHFNSIYLKADSSVKNKICLVSKYPLKPTFEDFYLTGINPKNSSVMQDCSKKVRTLSSIFSKR